MIHERDELRWHSGDWFKLHTRRGYSMGYDGLLKGARWSLEKVDASVSEPAVPRDDEFREDLLIDPRFRSTLADYERSGWDRGHLVPSADRRENDTWQSETFLLSNMSPQFPGFNRGIWRHLESMIRSLAGEPGVRGVWCMSLPLFKPGKTVTTIGLNHLPVPHAFGKCVLAEYDGGKLRIWAITAPNEKTDAVKNSPLDIVERWAGFPIFDRLHERDKIDMQQQSLWW